MVLSSEVSSEVFLVVLPSLILICCTFPPLCSEATQFLVHLSKLCRPATGCTGPVLPSGSSVGELGRGKWGYRAGSGVDFGENPFVSAIGNTFIELIVSITA